MFYAKVWSTNRSVKGKKQKRKGKINHLYGSKGNRSISFLVSSNRMLDRSQFNMQK